MKVKDNSSTTSILQPLALLDASFRLVKLKAPCPSETQNIPVTHSQGLKGDGA